MTDLHAPLDLATTYLSLDGEGKVARHAVDEAFWRTINTNKELLGTLITLTQSDRDWPHWEMHPKGDEILTLLEGEITLVIETESGEERVPLHTGETFVVPKGAWHRALVPAPYTLLAITYGEGTAHKPL
jgi:mannose-6-phosphate isomerase-like protein (cupin superfamily)